MLPSRKKFKFIVPPSDRQLWAIGMVAVQWAQVESYVTTYVHGLTQHDPITRERFDRIFSFSGRVAFWEDNTRSTVLPQWHGGLFAIINETKQCLDLRNKIIHGQWSSDYTPFVDDLKATHVGRLAKPEARFQWKITFGDIQKVALRINSLNGNLFDFLRLVAGSAAQFNSVEVLQSIIRVGDITVSS